MYRRPATVLLCAFSLSCGGESGPGGAVIGSIAVTPNPVALTQQAAVQLQVAVLDEDGALLTGIPVTFAAGNGDLFTISNTGMVQSIGPAGASAITVRAGERSIQVPISVSATGNTIRILPSPAVVAQGQTVQLEVALLDLVGSPIPGATFTYSSSDEAIASVSSTGLVRSVGPSGQVTITAASGDLATQVQLAVTQAATSMRLVPNPVTMARSTTVFLNAQVLDVIGLPIAGAAVSFTAAPSSLLTVSQAGQLTASAGAGAGTVTATSGSLSTTVPVTVVDAGSLNGTIVATAPAGGGPYGVILGASGAVIGVSVEGTLHFGTFGSSLVQSRAVSSTATVGAALNAVTGKLYVAGPGTDALMEIDAANGNVLRRWAPSLHDQMYDVALSPDGQHVYVGGSTGIVYMIDAATMTSVTEFPSGTSVIHLLAHPSQPLIYASGQDQAREINVQTGVQRVFLMAAAQASALALSGDRLFVGSEGGAIGTVTLSTGNVTVTVVPDCPVYDLVATPDGKGLLVTCSLTGQAKILDSQTLSVVVSIATGGAPRRAAISLDGTSAVIANEFGWYDHVR